MAKKSDNDNTAGLLAFAAIGAVICAIWPGAGIVIGPCVLLLWADDDISKFNASLSRIADALGKIANDT